MEYINPTRRFPGVRWNLYYGDYTGVEEHAVNELQRIVQVYQPYVVQTRSAAAETLDPEDHAILVGTARNNPWIAKLAQQGLLTAPTHRQGYSLASLASPWAADRKLLVVAGTDPAGVLYGVQDFRMRVLPEINPSDRDQFRDAFDSMKSFALTDHPRIDNRGIWTWGYVIYDYRRFIDNMVRLKMNLLVIWNDIPPINCVQVLDYAHARGIRVILGFHWGWGLAGVNLARPEDRQRIKDAVVRNYRENYRGLKIDGIYFQTLTEHNELTLDGQSVAAAVCRLVNETAQSLWEIEPALYIQLGLHATSIRERYTDLCDLDPRVTIAWEDAGVIPYSYNPVTTPEDAFGPLCPGVESPEATIDYSRRLATFRKDSEFAMVAKGWTCLRWEKEFEHHGPFILGERDPEFIRRRLADRQSRWDKVNALWTRNLSHALRFYQAILECRPPVTTVAALIEDGPFEPAIQPAAAIFAEALWDPARPAEEILQLVAGMRP